jgi:hypothetical protein
MNYTDEKLNIEEVENITSKLSCDYNYKLDISEQEKLEQQLNSMFGQWREAD